jgi:hypothetical protein
MAAQQALVILQVSDNNSQTAVNHHQQVVKNKTTALGYPRAVSNFSTP